MSDLEKELATLLNCHSRENESDTADWILARYMMNCLQAFEQAFYQRNEMVNPYRQESDNKVKERVLEKY